MYMYTVTCTLHAYRGSYVFFLIPLSLLFYMYTYTLAPLCLSYVHMCLSPSSLLPSFSFPPALTSTLLPSSLPSLHPSRYVSSS